MAFEPYIQVTSLDEVGGGRMEPSAKFGRGLAYLANLPSVQDVLGPLPELATLAPTSPNFAGGGD